MPYLHQYDYIFVIGLLFAGLDAYNIGANDVANSFATSVASRSLTMRQAVVLAAICEFLGAVLVGAKVASTIKNGIISLSVFGGNPGIQMLSFTCALVASATWLMIATRNSWPVSTTYSIVSALAGVGVALGGGNAVQWGWNGGKGLATIFAGFAIAPGLAGVFGAIVYLITKFVVLVRNDPVRWGLYFSPVYFFAVAAILTMSIIYKGSPELKLDKLPEVTIALGIVLTGLVVGVLAALFFVPFAHAKVVKKDYTLRWWHFFYGPLLWRRPAPERLLGEAVSAVPDYRVKDRDQPAHGLPTRGSTATGASEGSDSPGVQDTAASRTHAKVHDEKFGSEEGPLEPPVSGLEGRHPAPLEELEREIKNDKDAEHKIEGPWILPRNLWIIVRYKVPKVLLHGTNIDVNAMQMGQGKDLERIHKMHEHATQYENETEYLYSFLQVMTACTASFAHGANDVANAVGPFAAIYYVWSNGVVTPSNTPTPTWILVFGAVMIVLGLATYGYNIMSAIGNRLTMHSPSRGFSMELGAAITVLLASQYGIPVSSTMCITGATAGVGLVSSGVRGLNYRAFGWILLGWVLTVPIAGAGAGLLLALFINAPHR